MEIKKLLSLAKKRSSRMAGSETLKVYTNKNHTKQKVIDSKGKKFAENIEEIADITEKEKYHMRLMKFLKYLEREGFYNCSPEDSGIIKDFLKNSGKV